jgi:hypothetical protein
MSKNLDVSNSNNILQTIVTILIVAGIAYLIYYLYNQNTKKNNSYKMAQPSPVMQEQAMPVNRRSPTEESGIQSANYQMTGSASGQSNPIMNKTNYLPKGQVVGSDAIEHFNADPNYQAQRNLTSFPKDQLTAEELLPQDNSSLWAQVNPAGEGSLKDRNFLQSGYHIGINTVGQTLRNANLQLRSEPPCPQVKVSPWAQSTITPDVSRKPFEIGGCA